MLTYLLDHSKDMPLYQQLYYCIKNDIEKGNLRAGEKLPSKRKLADNLNISIVTVQTALEQLVMEGYLKSKERSGYYVGRYFSTNTDLHPNYHAVEAEEENTSYKIDFDTADVNTGQFPFSIWAKLMRKVLSEKDRSLLLAIKPQGVYELRREIAQFLLRTRSINVDPQRIIIGSGTEHLLGFLTQILPPYAKYGVENPGYQKTQMILNSNKKMVIPIDLDSDGLNIKGAIANLIDVLHVTSSQHFPLGDIMPVSRRAELLSWAEAKEGRYIIEDDYDSEFRFTGRPVPPLKSLDSGDKTIYISTFAKNLAPSLRISYMILPKPLFARYMSDFSFYACTVPSFEQYVLAEFIGEGYYERHLSRMKNYYRQLRDFLLATLKESSLAAIMKFSGIQTGTHLLASIDNGMDECQLVNAAQKQGIRVYGISEYYFPASHDIPPSTVVMGYGGLEQEQIIKAVQCLEKAWLAHA